MTRTAVRWMALAALVCLARMAPLYADEPQPLYNQISNIVYHETDGIGLVMDIFTPTGPSNGIGVIDVISGAWKSNRSMIEDHRRAGIFDVVCGRGYTVFAIRPGSNSKFTIFEMLDHLHRGIRWVKAHADEYGIDPDRLGITGASAGGHLASLAVVTAKDGNPSASDPLARHDTRLMAAAVFFPPTDFLNWRLAGVKLRVEPGGATAKMLAQMICPFYTGNDKAIDEFCSRLEEISPARLVTGREPPFLIIHGDADQVVPLEQSEILLAALQEKGVTAELIVKPGGGHPWPTIAEEVAIAIDWLEEKLGLPATAAEAATAGGSASR